MGKQTNEYMKILNENMAEYKEVLTKCITGMIDIHIVSANKCCKNKLIEIKRFIKKLK